MSDVFDNFNERIRESIAEQTRDRQSTLVEGQRNHLRDYAVQLRETQQNFVREPANLSSPSFALGPVQGFRGPLEPGRELHASRGQLSPEGHRNFMRNMELAAGARNVGVRDQHTREAAKSVANDLAGSKRTPGNADAPSRNILQQARSQVVYNFRNLAESLGAGQVASAGLAYSLERALEIEGLKAIANKAIDSAGARLDKANATSGRGPLTEGNRSGGSGEGRGPLAESSRATGTGSRSVEGGPQRFVSANSAPDTYRGSTGATSANVGVRNNMQRGFADAMNKVGELGATREQVKGFLNRNMGRLHVIVAVAENREVLARTAQTIAGSESTIKAVMSATTDKEVREAVGTIVKSGGETVMPVSKGAGSIAILAGSAMRGDSNEELGRHLFIASMTAIGGALGAVGSGAVSGGSLAIFGGIAGAEVGAHVGDAILNKWDKMWGNEPKEHEATVTQKELQDSGKVIGDKASEIAREQGLKNDMRASITDTAAFNDLQQKMMDNAPKVSALKDNSLEESRQQQSKEVTKDLDQVNSEKENVREREHTREMSNQA